VPPATPTVKLSESGTFAIFVHINANFLMNFNSCPFCVHLRREIELMTNITDIAFLNFLASKGVAPDEYGGFDGATKLGFIQAFEKHQQPPAPAQGNYPIL